jgi:hypothetical protein
MPTVERHEPVANRQAPGETGASTPPEVLERANQAI